MILTLLNLCLNISMIKNGEIFDHGVTSKVLTKNNIIDCYDLKDFENLGIITS